MGDKQSNKSHATCYLQGNNFQGQFHTEPRVFKLHISIKITVKNSREGNKVSKRQEAGHGKSILKIFINKAKTK